MPFSSSYKYKVFFHQLYCSVVCIVHRLTSFHLNLSRKYLLSLILMLCLSFRHITYYLSQKKLQGLLSMLCLPIPSFRIYFPEMEFIHILIRILSFYQNSYFIIIYPFSHILPHFVSSLIFYHTFFVVSYFIYLISKLISYLTLYLILYFIILAN